MEYKGTQETRCQSRRDCFKERWFHFCQRSLSNQGEAKTHQYQQTCQDRLEAISYLEMGYFVDWVKKACWKQNKERMERQEMKFFYEIQRYGIREAILNVCFFFKKKILRLFHTMRNLGQCRGN